MKRKILHKFGCKIVGFGVILLLAGLFMACPEDDSSPTPAPSNKPTVTSVTVTPATADLGPGGGRQFTAAVVGTNNPATTVTWTVEKGTAASVATGTTISSSGNLSVASNQVAGTIIVKATSTVDTAKSGTATVTIKLDLTATVTSVTVTPATATVNKGETRQFTATVTGTNNPSTAVTWSLTGNTGGSNISTEGLLTVSATQETPITVRATSVADSTKSGTALVSIAGAGAIVTEVNVSPATTEVQQGSYVNFSVEVIGTGNPSDTVTWSVTGGVGTTAISSAGRLDIDEAQPVTGAGTALTVRATSTHDTTKFGTALVTIIAGQPVVESITVTPGEVEVLVGGPNTTFTATVHGKFNPSQDVNWTIVREGTGITTSEIVKTAGVGGVLTVSAAEQAVEFKVRATSTANASIFGEATITLPGCICCRAVCGKECGITCICMTCAATCPPVLMTLAVTEQPTYIIPQFIGSPDLDTAGLVVTATYNKGPTSTLIDEHGNPLYTIEPPVGFNINTAGTYRFKVTHSEREAEFEVKVAELTGITLVSTDVPVDYYQFYDTALRGIDGIQVYAQFSDGLNDHHLTNTGVEAYTVNTTAVNFNVNDDYDVVFDFNTKKANFEVTVHELTGIDIDLATNAYEHVLSAAEVLTIGGINVVAEYGSHVVAIHPHTPAILTAANVTVGTTSPYNVTIEWNTKSDSYTFTVITGDILDTISATTGKTTYRQFVDELDKDSITVTAHYTESADVPVASADWDVGTGTFDNTIPGTFLLEVSYTDAANVTRNTTISMTIIAATGLTVTLSEDVFELQPDEAKILSVIDTAVVNFADGAASYDLKANPNNVTPLAADHITITDDIVIMWNGVASNRISYSLRGSITIVITPKAFTDVGIDINLGTIGVLDTAPIIHLAAEVGFHDTRWYLNNTLVASDTGIYVLEMSKVKIGPNVLTVEAKMGTLVYRKNIVFNVTF